MNSLTIRTLEILIILDNVYLLLIAEISPIPGAIAVLSIITFVVIVLYFILNSKIRQYSFPKVLMVCWIIFFIIQATIGLLICADFDIASDFLFQSVGYFCIAVGIIIVANEKKSIAWFLVLVLIICIVSSILLLLNPYDFSYGGGIVVWTLGEHNNPHALGVLCLLGIVCAMYFSITESILLKIVTIIMSSAFLYIIILTGSRKAFLAGIVLLLLWSFQLVISSAMTGKAVKKILFFGFLAIIAYAAIVYFLYNFSDSMLFKRLYLGRNWGSDGRISLYKIAFDLFNQRPLFGWGYGQYAVASGTGTYSHSTYAELLSCTGIIGTVIFLFPYLNVVYNSLLLVSKKSYRLYIDVKLIYICIASLICLLLVALGQIIPYEYTLVLWSIIIFYLINNEEKKVHKALSGSPIQREKKNE